MPASTKNQITFRMHPRVFAALGADLVTNDIVAIMELVKNSYDALATRVDVRFMRNGSNQLSLEIEDNGTGMSRDTIENVWAVVATPYRLENPYAKSADMKRRVSGEKGLGRLSVARLGNQLELMTRAKNSPCLSLSVRWDTLENSDDIDDYKIKVDEIANCPFSATGTMLRIVELASDWDQTRFDDLRKSLARLIPPFRQLDKFAIWLTLPGGNSKAVEINQPAFIDSPPYLLKGQLDSSGKISAEYQFNRRGNKRAVAVTVDCLTSSSDPMQRKKKHILCGPFLFEIRAWDISLDELEDLSGELELSRKDIRDQIKAQSGISLYRDGVLVLPKSESTIDWIGLNLRRVSRVGMRMSTNQVIGYITISADKNPRLRDTSDRERLEDNQAFRQFCDIFRNQLFPALEKERDFDRQEAKHKEPPFKDLFASLSPRGMVETVERLTKEKQPPSDVVKVVQQFANEQEQVIKQIEKRLVYYSRLASLGIMAATIVHEVRNQLLAISKLNRLLLKAIDEGSDALKPFAQNIRLSEKAVDTLDHLANTFAPLANRGLGKAPRDCNAKVVIDECIAMNQGDLDKLKVAVIAKEVPSSAVRIDPADLTTIIVNLLTNAIYWLSQVSPSKRRIEIEAAPVSDGERLYIKVHDSGPGVDPGDEDRIFWPGVTKKPGGIGMGLTVASELVAQYDGKMHLIQPGELGGASFGFDIPVKK
jgi:signal transduction histidine kinase